MCRPGGGGGERLGCPRGERHGPERARLLPVRLDLPVDEDAAYVDDAGRPVDVAPLERKPLLDSQAGQGDEDGDGGTLGGELVGDRLELGDRVEVGVSRRFGSGFGTAAAAFSSSSLARTA